MDDAPSIAAMEQPSVDDSREEARRRRLANLRPGAWKEAGCQRAPNGRVLPKHATQDGDGHQTATDNTQELLDHCDRVLAWPELTPEVRENLERRKRILRWCSPRTKNYKQNRWRVFKHCASHIADYIDLFVWQFNPLERGKEVAPFILWDFQKAALLGGDGEPGMLECYQQGKSLIIEKSRDMGGTWLLLILADHTCRFREWQKWLCISKDADSVDRQDDPDALFWKLDFIEQHLPSWLQQGRRRGKERKNNVVRYPRTNSTITGQASTGKAGVGGRASAIIIEEFGEIEEDKMVRARTASTGPRFFIGTHRGTGKEFYKLTQTPDIEKRVMHWTQHPRKNQGLYSYDRDERTGTGRLRYWEYVSGGRLREIAKPKVPYQAGFEFVTDGTPKGGPHPGIRSPWYDAKCKEIGDRRLIAMDLDIDARGSVSTPFDPAVIVRLQRHCRAPLWEGDVTADGDFIEAKGGPLKLWCCLLNGRPPDGEYAFGADVSAGTGATPSCLSAANCGTGEKVLEYVNAHIKPDAFAVLAVAVCKRFNNAILAWEHHGGPGVTFGNTLMGDCGYRNVYEQEDAIRKKLGGRPSLGSPGWRPMGSAKNILIQQYALALENGEYTNPSEPALDECGEFKYDGAGKIMHSKDVGTDPEAARENHGDIVIADALSCKLVRESGRLPSKQPREERPQLRPEDNILTVAGRRAQRERERRAQEWD
jgi:hypothetical protein